MPRAEYLAPPGTSHTSNLTYYSPKYGRFAEKILDKMRVLKDSKKALFISVATLNGASPDSFKQKWSQGSRWLLTEKPELMEIRSLVTCRIVKDDMDRETGVIFDWKRIVGEEELESYLCGLETIDSPAVKARVSTKKEKLAPLPDMIAFPNSTGLLDEITEYIDNSPLDGPPFIKKDLRLSNEEVTQIRELLTVTEDLLFEVSENRIKIVKTRVE